MDPKRDEFQELRRLLACKRYEQPPPGFFERFPDRVIARIEAGQATESPGLWNWIVGKLEAKPVMAWAYGLAISGLLFVGIQWSETYHVDEASTSPLAGLGISGTTPVSGLSRVTGETGGFSSRAIVAVPSTSLSPAFRAYPPMDSHRGAGFRIQPVGFSYNP